MKNAIYLTTIVLTFVAATLVAVPALAQQTPTNSPAQKPPADAPDPPPPELQRLLNLAKDPDRLREAMSDPARIERIMAVMESDAVRQFLSDPGRVQQLMREIDPQAIQDVMRSVDLSKIRKAAAARWKARLKLQLGVTDEEWAALEPRVDAVVRARQETAPRPPGGGMRGMGMGFGLGRGGAPGGLPPAPPPSPDEPPSKLQEATADLRDAMNDPDASNGDVRRAMSRYRTAREKAREKQETAERELKELLTQRQEAILVMQGLLD